MAARPAGPPLGEAEAIAAAVAAAADEHGVDWDVTAEAKLLYDFGSVVSSAQLVCNVELRSKSMCFLEHQVQIRPDTGEIAKNVERTTILPSSPMAREGWVTACREQR